MSVQTKGHIPSLDFDEWENNGNTSFADYMRRRFEHEINTRWLEVAIGEVLRE